MEKEPLKILNDAELILNDLYGHWKIVKMDQASFPLKMSIWMVYKSKPFIWPLGENSSTPCVIITSLCVCGKCFVSEPSLFPSTLACALVFVRLLEIISFKKSIYRISANSFRRNYSFLNLTLCTVTFVNSTYRCGNYSREETIQGRKLYEEIRYLGLNHYKKIKTFHSFRLRLSASKFKYIP